MYCRRPSDAFSWFEKRQSVFPVAHELGAVSASSSGPFITIDVTVRGSSPDPTTEAGAAPSVNLSRPELVITSQSPGPSMTIGTLEPPGEASTKEAAFQLTPQSLLT